MLHLHYPKPDVNDTVDDGWVDGERNTHIFRVHEIDGHSAIVTLIMFATLFLKASASLNLFLISF